MPPPCVKIGRPTRPSATYTSCDSAPYHGPSTQPAIAVKNVWSVMEEYPRGMRMKAPTAVSAAKSATRVIVRIFIDRFLLFSSG